MTATPGAPAAVPTDVESVPIRAARRSGTRMLVVASEATIALGALWLLVMVLPYLATPSGTTIALADAGPLRDSTVLPRLVGVVLSAVAAALALALPRWRAGFSCTAASALAALAAFSAWWAFGVRTGSGTPPRIGWYADLVLAVLAVVTVWLTAIGVRRSLTGWPRLHDRRLLSSTPYVAVTTAAVAVVTDWLLIRDPLFPAAFAAGSEAVVTDQAPLAMRLVAALMAILLVVVPVLATIAPERRVGQGLALGWPAMVAVLATRVVTMPGHRVDASFTAALVVVGVTTVALLVWLQRSGRTPPAMAPPAANERRAHDAEPEAESD